MTGVLNGSKLTHKLSTECSHPGDYQVVNRILVAALQRLMGTVWRRRFSGFLPTMTLQLSQLPMIVGSGRVKI